MAKYRKKPVEIEAILWSGSRHNQAEVEGFIGEAGYIKGQYVNITTLEGDMKASPGDWIIKGIKGEFYPCKPDIFEATYEEVK